MTLNRRDRLGICLILVSSSLSPVKAADQEIAFTLGRSSGSGRSFSGITSGIASGISGGISGGIANLTFSPGTALQANYARRFLSLPFADLLGEVHFLASPQEQIASRNGSVTKDIATLYVTPGVRVKFLPNSRLSPWVAAGAGYSLYEQSTSTISGGVNAAPRHTSGIAVQFGGGLDYKILAHLSLRAEIREFYTGSPSFNVPVTGTGQRHMVAGGGIVLRFGR
jgi:opacity protein-like surface antigen